MRRSIITGTGSYIPTEIKTNQDFTVHSFYLADKTPLQIEPQLIVDKFEKITGIAERKYTADNYTCSDIAFFAAKEAIADSGIEMEAIDLIIVAHNFGDIKKDTLQSNAVPAIASRVKHLLKINNPACVAFDILFGCPGWIQGMIQAEAYFKSGMATNALVIGAETLSRVIDAHDRDSMIFSDGAGAVMLEYKEDDDSGILSHSVLSHTVEEVNYLYMDESYHPEGNPDILYMKMKGRKVYEYAMRYVPDAMKVCFDKSGLDIADLKKIFIHQANEKMDEAIVQAFYKLYGIATPPANIMPMCIHFLGNSSVATVPTLYDLVKKGQYEEHEVAKGDIVLFASVGAGMNINAVCYRV